MEFTMITLHLGAEVTGIDLSKAMTPRLLKHFERLG